MDLLGKRALQLAPASSNQAQATSQHSAEVSSRQQVEHQSELAAQPNDSSPAADPANADKENVSVNQPVVRVRRGRKGPKLSRQHEMLLQQPGFVINFLTAAEDAKVTLWAAALLTVQILPPTCGKQAALLSFYHQIAYLHTVSRMNSGMVLLHTHALVPVAEEQRNAAGSASSGRSSTASSLAVLA